MSINHRRRALAFAALAALAGGSPAAAQTIDVTGTQRQGAETRSVQVAYGDLDLNDLSGRARLDRRIRWAAGEVCGGKPIKRLDARNDHVACSMAAVDGALAELRARVPTMAAGGD